MNEGRILMLGGQVLIGATFRLMFADGFEKLPAYTQFVEVGSLWLMLLALGILLVVPPYHFLVENGENTRRFHELRTLCCKGQATNEIKEKLTRLAASVEIHILTADRNVKSSDNFGSLPVRIHVLSDKDQDVQKRQYLGAFDPKSVVVLGNGNNDRLLLEAVKTAGGLCIAVDNGEGCSVDALLNAHMLIRSASEALDLLLAPNRCATTLRY